MPLREQIKFNRTTNLLCVFVCCLFYILGNDTASAQDKIYTVVLDAGHGGADPGNLGSGFQEKNIALKVTLKIGELLKKEKGVKVVYTRENDVFVELWKRGQIANNVKADLFVSVHCDSHDSQAYGAGTFVLGARGNKRNLEIAKRENSVIELEKDYQKNYNYNPNSPESVIGLSLLQEENLDQSLLLASLIQKGLVQKLKRRNRKVKMDNFQVLRETVMPSVLVELGFLTNKNEGRYLNSKKGQLELAQSVSKSIIAYVHQLKLNRIDIVGQEIAATALPETTSKSIQDEVYFKIQITSGRRKIATKKYNFKGLANVQRVKVQRFYKYYYGKTSNYVKIKSMLREVKEKGFRTAFIAAFKNGEKIPVKEALKTR